MRIGEVAEALGVSVGTARNYFDAGAFRKDKTRRLAHGDRRVRSEEVDRYLRELDEQRGE
ncbi:helix-turn-helix domain-containing protein [Micromonospora costi]|nr:helix-turn-helix domain-containing protein [Micromonospora costi]